MPAEILHAVVAREERDGGMMQMVDADNTRTRTRVRARVRGRVGSWRGSVRLRVVYF